MNRFRTTSQWISLLFMGLFPVFCEGNEQTLANVTIRGRPSSNSQIMIKTHTDGSIQNLRLAEETSHARAKNAAPKSLHLHRPSGPGDSELPDVVLLPGRDFNSRTGGSLILRKTSWGPDYAPTPQLQTEDQVITLKKKNNQWVLFNNKKNQKISEILITENTQTLRADQILLHSSADDQGETIRKLEEMNKLLQPARQNTSCLEPQENGNCLVPEEVTSPMAQTPPKPKTDSMISGKRAFQEKWRLDDKRGAENAY